MANPTVSPREAQTIKTRISVAENYRKRVYDPLAERAWQRYKGQATPEAVGPAGATDPYTLNLAWALLETKIHSLGFNFPDIEVLPQTDAAVPWVPIAQAAVRYEWEHAAVQPEVKRALRDRVVGNLGIVFLGWEFETVDEDGSEETVIHGARPRVEGEPAPNDGLLENNDEAEALPPVPLKRVLKDQPMVRRIDPITFFCSPETENELNRAAYCGYTELRPLDEVRKDPRFKNVRDLRGSSANLKPYLGSHMQGKGEGDLPSDVKRVKLLHYYEKSSRRHIILTDEHDKPILVERWSWDYDGYPFEILAGSRSPDEFWGTPESLYWEHPLREIEQAKAIQAENLRRARPKIVVNGEPLTPAQKRQLKSSEPYTALELRQGQQAGNFVLPQQLPEIGAAVTLAWNDIEKISATNQYDLGNAPTKRLAGGEVQEIAGAGQPRVQADRQQFERFCGRIATRMLQLLRQFSAYTRRLPIYDQDGRVSSFGNFDARQIDGEFDCRVVVGSTTAPNSSAQLQAIGYLLQGLAPVLQLAPQLAAVGINPQALVQQIVRLIPELQDRNLLFAPQGMPPAGGMPQAMAPGMPPGMPPGAMQALPPGGPLPPVVPQGLPDQPPGPLSLLGPILAHLAGQAPGGL